MPPVMPSLIVRPLSAAAAGTRQFIKRQIGHHSAAAALRRIEDDLVGAAEHALHRFEIHALAGHLGRLFVFIVDFREPRGLAGRLGNGLRLVGVGGLQNLRGASARLRHHAIGVGLRFVLRTLEVGARRLHVAERVNDLRGRIDLLHLYLLHQDAGAVMVERLLHQLLHCDLDALPGAGQDRLDFGPADHLAHRAFRDRLHRALRVLDVEKVFADAARLDPPQHREIDIDDVLVAGEHQALLRHVAHRGAAAKVVDDAHADVDLAHLQRLGRERALNRIRQMIVEARIDLANLLAETQHDATLVGLDPEETGNAPQHDRAERDQRKAAATEIAAGQHTPQLVLAAPQQLL